MSGFGWPRVVTGVFEHVRGSEAFEAARPAVPDSDDDALVRAAQANPQAFDLIYRRYADQMFAYMRARLANEADAADLAQQVFVRAFQALPRYRPGKTPFGAWLFRIAANAVTDEFRGKRRQAVSLDFVPEASLAVPYTAPEDDGRLRALRASVARLSAIERELLTLRFAAGLSAREIGAALGKSEAAAQKQLNRTLHKLKELSRDHYPS